MFNLESIFRRAYSELRPQTPAPEIKIEFFPFAGLNHTARLNRTRLLIRVSDAFVDAPPEIYRSLALILLAKLYKKKIDRIHHRTYRTFILSDEMRRRAHMARTHRRRAERARGSKGAFADLSEIFERLNREYFEGTLSKPRLSWSRSPARRILGRYDAAAQTIFISRIFDRPEAPAFVLDFVMFHEMLHLKYPSRVQDSRRVVHTSEFRDEEKRFLKYEEARAWLRGI